MEANYDETTLVRSQSNSLSRNSSLDESYINGTSGLTRKASAKHLYSVKDREKQIQKERDELQANMKNLQQQLEGQKDVDKVIVTQLNALQQAFDSHLNKWTETENLVISLRNQKGELEAEVKNLYANLSDATNEIRTKDQRIEELERQLQNAGHVPTVSQVQHPQVVVTPAPPSEDFSRHFQEVNHVLGSINSQLQTQFATIRRLVEENNGNVTQLQTVQNDTQNALSQIQQAQSNLQTAVTSIPRSSSSSSSTSSAVTPKPVEQQVVDFRTLAISLISASVTAALAVGALKIIG